MRMAVLWGYERTDDMVDTCAFRFGDMSDVGSLYGLRLEV